MWNLEATFEVEQTLADLRMLLATAHKMEDDVALEGLVGRVRQAVWGLELGDLEEEEGVAMRGGDWDGVE